MSDSVTTRQLRRRLGKPALFGALAFLLAGCAGADAPLPFITSPDPETTATATPAEPAPSAHGTATNEATHAPAASQAAGAAASGGATTGVATNGAATSGTASHQAPHSPVRQDLPFPSFATPTTAGTRPVLNDTEKAKMQSDLEGLAKSRETKMRQDIEQAQ